MNIFVVNVELMMYLGDLALGELNLLKFIMDLKKAQLNNPFVLLDSLMENGIFFSKNMLKSYVFSKFVENCVVVGPFKECTSFRFGP